MTILKRLLVPIFIIANFAACTAADTETSIIRNTPDDEPTYSQYSLSGSTLPSTCTATIVGQGTYSQGQEANLSIANVKSLNPDTVCIFEDITVAFGSNISDLTKHLYHCSIKENRSYKTIESECTLDMMSDTHIKWIFKSLTDTTIPPHEQSSSVRSLEHIPNSNTKPRPTPNYRDPTPTPNYMDPTPIPNFLLVEYNTETYPHAHEAAYYELDQNYNGKPTWKCSTCSPFKSVYYIFWDNTLERWLIQDGPPSEDWRAFAYSDLDSTWPWQQVWISDSPEFIPVISQVFARPSPTPTPTPTPIPNFLLVEYNTETYPHAYEAAYYELDQNYNGKPTWKCNCSQYRKSGSYIFWDKLYERWVIQDGPPSEDWRAFAYSDLDSTWPWQQVWISDSPELIPVISQVFDDLIIANLPATSTPTEAVQPNIITDFQFEPGIIPEWLLVEQQPNPFYDYYDSYDGYYQYDGDHNGHPIWKKPSCRPNIDDGTYDMRKDKSSDIAIVDCYIFRHVVDWNQIMENALATNNQLVPSNSFDPEQLFWLLTYKSPDEDLEHIIDPEFTFGYSPWAGYWGVSDTYNSAPWDIDQRTNRKITPILISPDLGDSEQVWRGTYLDHYQESDTSIFYQESLPKPHVKHIESIITETNDLLFQTMGWKMATEPDIYLISNYKDFAIVENFLNVSVEGFEAGGFQLSSCRPNPYSEDPCNGGIYLNLDAGNGVDDISWHKSLVAHEYTHFYVRQFLSNRQDTIPIWFNEGLAMWIAHQIRPEALGDDAIDAYHSRDLIPLQDLESNKDWNARTGNKVAIQYSESGMAIEYFINQFGTNKLADIFTDTSRGGSINRAFETNTGITYQAFENNFFEWLGTLSNDNQYTKHHPYS